MRLLGAIARYTGNYLLHLFSFVMSRYSLTQPIPSAENQSYKRYHHMDESLPDDIEDVLEISAILEVREYDLFQLAYLWWFGRPASSRVMESHFARYMFNKIVPHWMRHYSRMLLELRDQGKLDKEELGIARLPDATPQSVRAGVRYTVIVFSVLALLLLIAEMAVRFNVFSCMFPPCY